MVHGLLTSQKEEAKGAESLADGNEVVLYFASHTIISKLQAGQLPPDLMSCRQQLPLDRHRVHSIEDARGSELIQCLDRTCT